MSTQPSDEGARHLVDQMMITLLAQLPADLAAELEHAVDAGAVEWSDAEAERTAAGALSFTALARSWLLDRDEDGAFVQVVQAGADDTFASTWYRNRVALGSLLDHVESIVITGNPDVDDDLPG